MTPEKVIKIVTGKIVVYADRLEITRGYFLGKKTKTILLSSITSLEERRTFTGSPRLRLGVLGQSLGDDDELIFGGFGAKAKAEEAKAYLQRRIGMSRADSNVLVSEEIRSLARLRDEGVLSETEFAGQKARLLK